MTSNTWAVAVRWSRRLLLVTGLAATSAQAGSLAPPGEMVDLGTHRLHLLCTGSGTPTVVIDAGLGSLALEWRGVQQALSGRQRVCLYDRAGYGWSDPGPLPRTVDRITDELHHLLEVAKVPAPYVLVGHSFGGYTVQLYAKRYPQQVAGMVLVDASHPGQVQRFLESPLAINTAPSRKVGQVQYSGFVIHDNLPDDIREAVYQVGFTPKARAAMTAEYLYFRDSAAEVGSAGELPDRPLVVLSRGEGDEATLGRLSIERQEAIETLWLELQRELADLAPRAAHLIAERSGHQIHLDQPDLIADAVNMVVDFAVAERSPNTTPDHWLAFKDASWRVDRLHASLSLESPHRDPSYMVFQQQIQAGHFAGSDGPAFQQVVYFEGRN
jgi:pimeloyl-ACP methyl ester carboxylesterase